MHASYSNHIEYIETPTLPVLNGPPSWVVRSASIKRPIRSSIQTVKITFYRTETHAGGYRDSYRPIVPYLNIYVSHT